MSSTVNASAASPIANLHLAAALALAAALQDLHLIFPRLLDVELPLAPVVLVRPVADRVLVRLRLVAQVLAVRDRRRGRRA